VARAVAEAVPFANAVFDCALVVTTLCFVDDTRAALREIAGTLVIGMIDRESALGQNCSAHRAESLFYREATFYSPAESEALLRETGFNDLAWAQTLSSAVSTLREIEPAATGTGRGAFVVVRAQVSREAGTG
jgi:hypothetical protein